MQAKNLRYPIGLQDFAKIRETDSVYADKTDIIYKLTNSSDYVFLARPRRFGKSLLLSTIKYYLGGRKDLFEGLRIMDLEKKWTKHPVLHLELSGTERGNFKSLQSELDRQFQIWENDFDLPFGGDVFSSRFRKIVKGAYDATGQKVVILIDEYDNPLINSLDDPNLHEKFKDLLKSVYSCLKDMDAYIRFGMITGVSRFSKTSIFSGLNNLDDISFDDAYAAICGFTLDDIKEYMWPGVLELGERRKMSTEETLQTLKDHYDGYHFTEESPDIYNPFSLLNALSKSTLGNYWMASGTPEFLVRKLKDTPLDFTRIFNPLKNADSLGATDLAYFSPEALLYQTGYLTIKGYDPRTQFYRLGVPNREINGRLFSTIISDFLRQPTEDNLLTAFALRDALTDGKPEEFFARLKSFLAGIPYDKLPHGFELNFEKILFSMIHLLDLDVRSEAELSNGRIDLLIKTERFIYVIELKMAKSPEEALAQIDSKDYALPWQYDGRKIFKIGVSVSTESRNITNCLIFRDRNRL